MLNFTLTRFKFLVRFLSIFQTVLVLPFNSFLLPFDIVKLLLQEALLSKRVFLFFLSFDQHF